MTGELTIGLGVDGVGNAELPEEGGEVEATAGEEVGDGPRGEEGAAEGGRLVGALRGRGGLAGTRRARWASLVLLLLASPLHTMEGQTTTHRRVQLDNDYFNFWLPPDERPDNDYTQGISVEFPARWVLGLLGRRSGPHCPRTQANERTCAAGLLGLKQEIYTPEQDAEQLMPGQRPYLGLLAGRAAVRWQSAKGVEEVWLEAGVTGPPSLAEVSQKAVHRLLEFREPLGWSGQLPFEPVLGAGYENARLLGQLTAGGSRVAALSGHTRIRLGNMATDLRAGACVVVGWNVSGCHKAWSPLRVGVGVGVRVNIDGDVVIYNLSLDGSTFAEGPRVSKKTGVIQRTLGIEFRVRGLTVELSAIRRSREYSTQTKAHTFSRIGVTF